MFCFFCNLNKVIFINGKSLDFFGNEYFFYSNQRPQFLLFKVGSNHIFEFYRNKKQMFLYDIIINKFDSYYDGACL